MAFGEIDLRLLYRIEQIGETKYLELFGQTLRDPGVSTSQLPFPCRNHIKSKDITPQKSHPDLPRLSAPSY